MEGEWPCYGGGQFNGRKMVLLQRRLVQWRGNGNVTEVVSLMEGEWSCYGGGQFNGGSMVMLQVVTLMTGEWSFYIN